MLTDLCAQCYLQGYCRRLQSRLVEPSELTPAFVADVRAYMRAQGRSRDAWKPYLIDSYQDYPGPVVRDGREVWLDTSVFDAANIRYWFRDLCRLVPNGVRPRLRKSVGKRFIVTVSILRALDPIAASRWGKREANDNGDAAMPPPVRVSGCPYPHFPYLGGAKVAPLGLRSSGLFHQSGTN